jgi:hypothetical protein
MLGDCGEFHQFLYTRQVVGLYYALLFQPLICIYYSPEAAYLHVRCFTQLIIEDTELMLFDLIDC